MFGRMKCLLERDIVLVALVRAKCWERNLQCVGAEPPMTADVENLFPWTCACMRVCVRPQRFESQPDFEKHEATGRTIYDKSDPKQFYKTQDAVRSRRQRSPPRCSTLPLSRRVPH